MRILLVEDHSDSLEALSRVLRIDGHEVTGAATHADAIRLCQAQHFDLVICDIGLPDGDGWDIAEVARECGSKAIALSGYGMPEDVAHARRSGFAAHLLKPITFERLRSAISGVFPPEISPSAISPA